ncbi:MAG: fibronectin type III domain-containing protein [Bacteroidales bacterium]|jgi:hypothetical protein|nr:fibronectin type III domain-containing protein [Bacteroidales bacterium]
MKRLSFFIMAIIFAFEGWTQCNSPMMVSAVPTATSVVVSWDANSATEWKVQLRTNAMPPVTLQTQDNLTSTTCTFTGLTPNTTYGIVVTAYCNGSLVFMGTGTSFTTSSVSCEAPTNLSVSALTTTWASVNWTAASGTSAWQVVLDDTTATSANATVTTHLLTGLVVGTSYTVYVRTDCGTGYSDWVGYPFVHSYTQPCASPTTITTSPTTTSVDISWEAGAATEWKVQLQTDAMPPVTLQTQDHYTSTTCTFTGLTPNTTYRYAITAYCNGSLVFGGTGGTFTTLAASPCDVPTGLTVSAITHNAATVTWDAGSATAWQFVIDDTTETPEDLIVATKTLIGLSSNTSYIVYVRTDCGSNNYSSWTQQTFTTDIPCEAPSIVTVNAISNDEATISWEAGNMNEWRVQLTLFGDSPTSGNVLQSTDVTVPTHTFTGLTAGTHYMAHVNALCGGVPSTVTTSVDFYANVSGLDIRTLDDMKVILYPNPANDFAILEAEGVNVESEVTVTDIVGRIIMKNSLNAGKQRMIIDTKTYTAGIYYVNIINSLNSKTLKLIIDK